MCTITINVIEPSAFNLEFQYFISLFNNISWFCRQQPRGDETSNEGCNSSLTRHDFTYNANNVEMMATDSSTLGF
jgi:hypothetical protein